MCITDYERNVDTYTRKENEITFELEHLMHFLENHYFSFNYDEDMSLEQYHNLTYRLTFKRTEYSKPRSICILMDSLKIDDNMGFYIKIVDEEELGHMTGDVRCNDIIKRFMDRIIQSTKKTIDMCNQAILCNKYYIYKEKYDRGSS